MPYIEDIKHFTSMEDYEEFIKKDKYSSWEILLDIV